MTPPPPITKMPRPEVPSGMTPNQFGKDVIGWRSKPQGTVERTSNITQNEVERMMEQGLTQKMAQEWKDFYANEFMRNPDNLTAQARTELMKKIIEMQKNATVENKIIF